MEVCCHQLDEISKDFEDKEARRADVWENEARIFVHEAMTQQLNAEVYAQAVNAIGLNVVDEMRQRDIE